MYKVVQTCRIGIGIHYKVINRNLVQIAEINDLLIPYTLWTDPEQGVYYITRDNIVVFCDRVTDNHNISAEEVAIYFVNKRRYAMAIEIAALGQWTDFREYVRHNWEDILKEMCE